MKGQCEGTVWRDYFRDTIENPGPNSRAHATAHAHSRGPRQHPLLHRAQRHLGHTQRTAAAVAVRPRIHRRLAIVAFLVAFLLLQGLRALGPWGKAPVPRKLLERILESPEKEFSCYKGRSRRYQASLRASSQTTSSLSS